MQAVRDDYTVKTDTVIVAATAHPAKFPDAVKSATGIYPELPDHLSDLFERTEDYITLPNDVEALKSLVKNSV